MSISRQPTPGANKRREESWRRGAASFNSVFSAGRGEAGSASRDARNCSRRGSRTAAIVMASILAGTVASLPWMKRTASTVAAADSAGDRREVHVTPRAAGQVEKVLIKTNQRVKKGELLGRLDREPCRLELEARQAAIASAEAELAVAEAETRGLAAQARSRRWQLQAAIEQVHNDIAALKAAAAILRSRQATRDRARSDYKRVEPLIQGRTVSTEEFEQREADLEVATAAVDSARQQVFQLRAALGVPPEPQSDDLADVPDGWDTQASKVRAARAEAVAALAELGCELPPGEPTAETIKRAFRQRDDRQDADHHLSQMVAGAPKVKLARAKLEQARCALKQAQLDLEHCDILAETDGVVQRVETAPGSYVNAGQTLAIIRAPGAR